MSELGTEAEVKTVAGTAVEKEKKGKKSEKKDSKKKKDKSDKPDIEKSDGPYATFFDENDLRNHKPSALINLLIQETSLQHVINVVVLNSEEFYKKTNGS